MKGAALRTTHNRGDGFTRALFAAAIMVLLLALATASPFAVAKRINGTNRADRVVGTKRADVIRLKGGNDRAWGNGGADRLYGGAGRDRLLGNKGGDRLSGDSGADTLSGAAGRDRLTAGKGADRLLGGAGNDVLNSADGSKDKRVDGGKGSNSCVVDGVDLSVISGCGTLTVRGGSKGGGGPGGGGSGGGGSGGGSGGGGAGGGSGTPLTLTTASGLSCASSLPVCPGTFDLSGNGADSQFVTVTGTGGVTAAGTGPATSEGAWTATGAYSCTSDGFLVVSDGQENFEVPVTCKVGE
jgi:hypothetical protein